MKKFSANILHLREILGIKQNRIAQLLEITPATVSNWEKGSSEPSLTNLVNISNAFKIDIDKLVRLDLTDLSKTEIEEIQFLFLKGKQNQNLIEDLEIKINELHELIKNS